MNNSAKSWILTDSRIGSNNQAIALAEELGLEYSIIKVEYNCLARLPNLLLPKEFYQIKSPSIKALLKDNKPSIVISASRKTAHICATIKSMIPEVKAIQILRPELDFSNFDLVILPQHDKVMLGTQQNIYRIIGALNNVNQRISQTILEFEAKYQKFTTKNYAVVLIGGNTKNFSFNKKSAIEFYNILLKFTQYSGIKYFLTYSRRTPKILKETLNSLINDGHIIYDPLSGEQNPYPAMLHKAKFIISTCDSISMSSEVASTGKPFYLYIPKGFNSPKHLTFSYQLSDLGIAKILNETTDFLQEYNYTPLNESRKAADYILSSILGVK